MAFPIASDYNFAQGGDSNIKMREAIDHAVLQHEGRRTHLQRLKKLYNSHNGIIDESEIEAITKFTGRTSKTKYVKYRLGRSKLKLLHGEFLMLPLEPQVRTVNQDAKNQKMSKYKESLAMAYTKDQIEQVRAMGFDVLKGMKIPSLEDKDYWTIDNFKLANEIIMQVLLEKKIKKEKIKREFHHNFVDLTITSEMYGKVEKDINGKVIYRVINPRYAIYEDSVYDPLLERTPYMGEKRMMYYHEIITSDEFNLSEDAKKKLKQYAAGQQSGTDFGAEKIGSQLAFPVWTIEWKGFEVVRRKTSYSKDSKVPYKMILSDEYYDKNKDTIKKDVKKGRYEVEERYREVLWKTSRIGNDIYTTAVKEDDLIQVLNENNVYNVQFNYCGYLFSTTDGERVSIQELVYELEKTYDDVRFQINKEMKKIKGNVLMHDDAFLPKGKRFIDVQHEIDEHGILRFNSAAEGNQSGRDMERQWINSVQLGSGEPLRILIEQAMELEQTMDRITGLNENRQGLTKATMTATANVNNIEASRSITYDLFFCMYDFMERTLLKILEKEKLCHDENEFIFDDQELKYLKFTRDVRFANYYPYLSDGRIEAQIREKLEMMFGAEINAGNLRTSDVAKFLRESSFAKAIKILDNANQELAKIRQEEIAAGQESQNNQIQANMQMTQEDREDRQQHEAEMVILKNEGEKEKIVLQESLKGMAQSEKV